MNKKRFAVICSLGIGEHERLLNLTRKNTELYAAKFGYDVDLRVSTLEPSRPAAWSKVLLISEELMKYKYVLWLDADTVVVNAREDFTKLTSRYKPLALVAHKYHGQTFPNTGVMSIRSTFITRRLFRRIWTMDHYLNHKWWENAAFLELLGYKTDVEPLIQTKKTSLNRRINWLKNDWNSMGLDPSSDPIIKHYPGVRNDDRFRFMSEDIFKLK